MKQTALTDKARIQIAMAGLPKSGQCPYRPKFVRNRRGQAIIEKADVLHGPKSGKRGWVDDEHRIWVRDRAHADIEDRWDVQIDEGRAYFRVDAHGNIID